MKRNNYQQDQKTSSAGLALIWVVMIVFGAITVLGVGSAARKKQKQETAFEREQTQSTLAPTQKQGPSRAVSEKTDQEYQEDILNQIRTQPPIPQADQNHLPYPPEAYQQQPDVMANPLSPETQQYCTASPGDPSCGIVKDIYGDQLQKMYGNVFGQPEPPKQYLNPMADPKFNPMADPKFNPMADPKINPLADPKFNPMADPKFNPMYVPGQYTPWNFPGGSSGFPNQPGYPPNIPGGGGLGGGQWDRGQPRGGRFGR